MADDKRPCVFLDRDGCLIEEVDYLSRPGQVRLIPGTGVAVRRLNEAGVLAVVVSNQSGIARGYFTEETLADIHARLREELARDGARLDAIYYCPFHPQAAVEAYRRDSPLRKPRPGMVERAAAEHPVDLARSYVVGDKKSDIELGRNCGLKTALVLTGYGRDELERCRAEGVAPDCVRADLAQAVEWALGDLQRPSET